MPKDDTTGCIEIAFMFEEGTLNELDNSDDGGCYVVINFSWYGDEGDITFNLF